MILRLHFACIPYVKIMNEASCWRRSMLKHDTAAGLLFSDLQARKLHAIKTNI